MFPSVCFSSRKGEWTLHVVWGTGCVFPMCCVFCSIATGTFLVDVIILIEKDFQELCQ